MADRRIPRFYSRGHRGACADAASGRAYGDRVERGCWERNAQGWAPPSGGDALRVGVAQFFEAGQQGLKLFIR